MVYLAGSLTFQAFDFLTFLFVFAHIAFTDRESHNAPRIVHVFLWFLCAKCGCTYHLCENTGSAKNATNWNTFVVAQRGRQTRVKRPTGVRKGIASCYRGKHHETLVSVRVICLPCYHGKIQVVLSSPPFFRQTKTVTDKTK